MKLIEPLKLLDHLELLKLFKLAKHEYSLKDLIDAALRKYNFDDSITVERVEQAYRDTVGEFIVMLTRAVNYDISTHTLKVTLSSPALKNELTYKLTDLAKAINKKLGKNEVWKIVFF